MIHADPIPTPAFAHTEAPSRFAMAEEILINMTPQETRVAVIQHGVTHELQAAINVTGSWTTDIQKVTASGDSVEDRRFVNIMLPA